MSNNIRILGVDFSIDGLIDHINELKAENERLKEQVANWTNIAVFSRAEVARLNGVIRKMIKENEK